MPDTMPPLPEHCRLSTEFRLLTACSWLPPAPLEHEQARLIAGLAAGPLDWNAFHGLIDRHRIPALVQESLGRHGGAHLPEASRKAIQVRARKASMQSLRHAGELLRVAPLFQAEGIDLLPLKGVTLSLRLYGEAAVRSLKDLDLLVRIQDLDRADRLLQAQGYRRTFPDFEPSRRMKAAIHARLHHYNYVNDRLNTHVELHWGFHELDAGHLERVWGRSRALPYRGSTLRHLDDGLLFLLLCAHGTSHRWFRMKWLSDVAMLVTLLEPEAMDDLLPLVRELGLEGSVSQTMLLLRWLYGVEAPAWLKGLVALDARSVELASMALDDILFPQEGPRLNRFRSRFQAWHYLRLQGKHPPVGRYLRDLALQPMDASCLNLPDPLFGLYYVLRPFLWAWRTSRRGR